ncbi:hypothetical protein TD95_000929 [Thielaviopsis punctulata]|uniref:Uncharacterized protein n=1 Tax=Thielaviopsis punctulata TaxID=72032 RepID=A0A0F4Z961_9PEZI|nr:hypothetical protein TD95_002141 [Thielaviopsis punctulata]KKA29214.1 hypothetical protein TD95_000929 [Thielaviopsis punctulata]
MLSSPVYSRASDAYEKHTHDEYDEWEAGSTGSFTPDDYIHHELQSRAKPSTASSRRLSSAETAHFPVNGYSTDGGNFSRLNDSLYGGIGYSGIISNVQLSNHSSQSSFAAHPDQSYTSAFSLYSCPTESQNALQMSPTPHITAVPPLFKRRTRLFNGSPLLQELLDQGRPTAELALHPRFFPFTTVSAVAPEAVDLPVVKLTNIPFNVSRNEIAVFLGRHHRVPDSHEPIHIMMCRNTGKTMEVFVELISEEDLEAVWERYEEGQRSNRPVKIGGRAITVQKSSQSELMRKMFPTVGGIVWEGSVPVRKQRSESQGRARRSFRGFISEEEVTMAVRHVEYPQKSPFSRGCPERAFEYLISTLRKYPWRYTSFIRLSERYNIFKLTFQLLDFLVERLPSKCHQGRLTATLLRRVLDAALRCPGFTPFMKANIAHLVGMQESQLAEYSVPRNAEGWKHQYGLVPKPRMSEDVIEVSLICWKCPCIICFGDEQCSPGGRLQRRGLSR